MGKTNKLVVLIICTIFTFLLFSSCDSSEASLYDDVTIDNITYTAVNLGKRVGYFVSKANTKITGSIEIPSMVNNKPVHGICANAFSNCNGLTNIIIPSTVEVIWPEAFSYCTGLTNITIPNSVTSIDRAAFFCCTGLTSIIIPNSVTSIGDYVFSGCTGLTDMTIPNSVTSIGDHAFSGCTGLTSIIIPNSVTSIGDYVFSGCTGITSMTIPESVLSLGFEAFGGWTSDQTINVKTGFASGNDDDAWLFCAAKVMADLGNDVTSIGDYAFYGCHGLTSIKIPNRVTSIGDYAVCDCSGLTSISIPSSVTSIGNVAFACCSGLESIIVDTNNPTYYSEGNCLVVKTSKVVICGCITSVLPDDITGIDSYAFENCYDLRSIAIPNRVTSIGEGAFNGCRLDSITYNGTKSQWGNISKGNNWNGNDAQTTYVYCSDGTVSI